MLPVNWYSKLYFIKFSPFSSIQKSRKIIRISQDLLPGHFTILHYLCHSLLLLKVLHTRLKDLHILFAVNVHGNCLASSLRVSHLTKDTAIRACDTFDCHVGTVWIPVFVHGHIALIVYILGRYLAICDQAVEPCFVCYETSFTVGSRIAVYTTQFCFCQPWDLFVITLV